MYWSTVLVFRGEGNAWSLRKTIGMRSIVLIHDVISPESSRFLQVLQTNLKSVFLLSQAAGRHMVPLRRGKIINFCSIITFQGGLTVPAYAAAKGGLGQLTKAMANEWSKENVQVNAICPGYIETDMYVLFAFHPSTRIESFRFARNEQLLEDPDRLRQISERIPAGRWGQSADLVGPVVFLASKASQFVCGELLVVDGVHFLFYPFCPYLR